MTVTTTLACVYRTGGDFSPEYVQRLVESMRRHSDGCRIVCLSDDPAVSRYCEHVPLVNDWAGWWSKLELFNLPGKTVYFDLDTVIKGDLTPLVEYPHQFTMLSDFYKPHRPASGVMAWEGDYRYLMDGFTMEKANEYRTPAKWGDQGWISERLDPDRWQDVIPGQIASYKASSKAEIEAAAVVCFHGRPRPHEVDWKV